ncbi:MAG: 2-C-methyl-D-erythritol 4-phosphate cytidylyltransferase [Actinobacteria bacterium]|nr:2-C-methyl-D-erythritol 4-phosphate cytidylyltransferase [Actinomycetota bacterium]
MRIAVVILAAGSGSRFSSATNKVWLPLGGRRIISRSIANAVKSFPGCRTVLVISPQDALLANQVLEREASDVEVELVEGGETRHDSEYNALIHLAPAITDGRINVVLIHDGARPLATSMLFHDVARTAHQHGGAVPAIVVDPFEIDYKCENQIVRVQTPQAFRASELLSAYQKAHHDKFVGTDTAACMEEYFPENKNIAVAGETQNVKITYPQDLVIAEHVLEMRGYVE